MILGAAVPPDHAKTLSVKAAEMRLSEHATDEDLLALRGGLRNSGS
ncbi:hypothetical protein GCM10025858_34220 [Alicyclobacillus sacchari]|nr:hypothetical protein [Alicyclobacillus sacchari]GMA58919.1 hypothetical protein GCM10025858_34220 [Alicyclobacillus sacchari]